MVSRSRIFCQASWIRHQSSPPPSTTFVPFSPGRRPVGPLKRRWVAVQSRTCQTLTFQANRRAFSYFCRLVNTLRSLSSQLELVGLNLPSMSHSVCANTKDLCVLGIAWPFGTGIAGRNNDLLLSGRLNDMVQQLRWSLRFTLIFTIVFTAAVLLLSAN